MYQLSRSKRDVQRFFSETPKQIEIVEDDKLPELDLPSGVIKDSSSIPVQVD
jgi:hypothetical protein